MEKSKQKIVSIVMTTDKNYILQTRVAIWSMLNSAKENTFFNIFILCDTNLKKEHRDKLSSLLNYWNNFKIQFKEIDEYIFRNAKTVAYIPVSSFYRLIISGILNDSRCLFLDGDIIVNSDLTDIYDTELTNVYIAGIKDCRIQSNMNEEKAYKLDIPTMKGYVNAGVLIFNLDLIRKDNIDMKFLEEIDNYYQYMDQDIINKCCFGKIKFLDLKFNVFNDFFQRIDLLKDTDFTEKELKEADDKFVIMHFAGKYKPWYYKRVRGSTLWWEFAKRALDCDDYNTIYNKAVDNTRKSDWRYILEVCKNEKCILIIGFSKIGKDVMNSLRRCGCIYIKCFCDNNKDKQLLEYAGLKVYSFEEALKNYPDALWINTSQRSNSEINEQLRELGVCPNRVICYFNKTKMYYDLLDEQYKEYESEQLTLKEYGKTV